jgi:hypothetical protein
MKARVGGLLVVAALVAGIGTTGCAPRQVEVRTAPTQPTQVSIQVTNKLSQAVNVYARSGGSDTFLRQVGANSTVTVPLQGFAPGTTVSLKAVTVDGTKTYTRDNVVLNGTYQFPLP